ncbi:MAG: GAF domain-containing protein, partial [Alphaproteobacteria bacterium]|nr:GAF domain-containing protein [Alphaproteobacteria bacterium]
DETYRSGNLLRRAHADQAGARSAIFVALRRDDKVLGMINIYRREVRPYSDKQIALLQNFAAQAVIAMENARLLTEQREALEQQTATTEVLEVINSSPGDLAPVFGAMLEKAMHLCEAAFGIFGRFDGRLFEPTVDRGVPAELIQATQRIESPPPGSGLGRIAAGESVVQLVDLANTDVYRAGFVGATALVDIGGAKTAIFVALRKDGLLLGVIVMYRREVRAFSDKQVALLQNFAAQAVIAMENARLINETRESLEQQTATADILRVISQSPTDVAPVLDVVVKAAQRFCGAEDVVISLRDGDELAIVAHEGPIGAPPARRKLDRSSAQGRAVVDASTVHLPDITRLDPSEWSAVIALSRQIGAKATLAAPMVREGTAVGAIMLRKLIPGPFTPRQIQLLETFAAQAVIALQNTRLFTELKESLEQQTATAEILRAISQSPTDVQPVLDAVVKAAVRFCGAIDAVILLREGEQWRGVAHEGPLGAPLARMLPLNRDTAPGRSMLDRRTIHYPDIGALDPAEHGAERANAQRMGFSSVVSAPLLRDNESIGAIALRNREAEPFESRQIELLESFAAQAVIAIENVRLFTELREALDQQTATADILRVISQSPTDVAPVLNVVAGAALRFCGANDAVIGLRDGDELVIAAHEGPLGRPAARRKLDRSSTQGRAVLDAQTIHIPDFSRLDPDEWAQGIALSRQFGFNSTLAAPMLRDGVAIGNVLLRRPETGPFSPRQIALLESFAAQAVIAIENVRLFTELKESLDQQTATAEILRVIAQSPTDVAPVLEAVSKAALRFCGAQDVAIDLREGTRWRCVAHAGILKSPVGMTNAIGRKDLPGRTMLDRAVTQIPDVEAAGPEAEFDRGVARQVGFRAALAAPMMRQDEAAGAIILHRTTPGAFSERQIALLESFAAQAVIALENTRLFTELQKRTDDLTESLDYQTATSELLEVISRSATDIRP